MKKAIRLCVTLIVILGIISPIQAVQSSPIADSHAASTTASTIELVGHFGGRAYTVALKNHYALLGTGVELSAWDVSNPVTPTQTGGVNLPAIPLDIAIAGNLAYVADGFGGGLQIVDISDMSNPSVVGSVIAHAVNTVAISGTFAYITSWDSDPFDSSLRVFDITTPTLPLETDVITTSTLINDLVITATYGYMAAAPDNLTGTLKVLDLSTPAHPMPVPQRSSVRTLPSPVTTSTV